MKSINIVNHSDINFEIVTFDKLYTQKELSFYIDYIESQSIKNKSFTNQPFKNGKIINEELSNTIYERIKPILPKVYTDRNNVQWVPIGCSKYIFYSKLVENQSFGIHTDTGSEFDINNNRYSKFTLLTYLNSDYEGGDTIFYDNNFMETATIINCQNETLIFDIDLYHKGSTILNGVKYWIGTEIICQKIE